MSTPPPSPADDPRLELLARCAFPPAGAPLVCGVSGGPDSLALLALAVTAGCRVTAVHVDHGIRSGSADEAEVVSEAARRFGAAFRSERVEVAAGPNLEARARDARRAALGPGAATGHTADDQAETVLVNLLRGAGVDGMAAMRAGPEHPLLGLRRAETHRLCADLGLRPVVDPSNEDRRFLRNRVRHELLPLCADLAGRDVVPVLARQASLLAADADVLAEVAALVDPTDVRAVSAAPVPVARRSIRAWLRGEGSHPPSTAAVDRVLAVARGEHRAAEIAGGVRVTRRRGELEIGGLPGGRGASGTVGP
ncbi:MAG: tRNA lysidine(34) synthetase TilS [Acidimicrobiales bacterium]